VRRLEVGEGQWVWSLEPYGGCELGCTFCPVRQGAGSVEEWVAFEREARPRGRVVSALQAALGPAPGKGPAREPVRGTPASPRRVVLGAGSEPWQPAEERQRLTRALLETLLTLPPVDVQVHTRSSLIARDTDLLRALAQRGRVTVAFSLASLDEKVNRLLEPRAPSALRRLSAAEALARAGLLVGVRLSPVLPATAPEELDGLLARAAQAGARFAELGFFTPGPSERARLLERVGQASPDTALRFRKLLQKAAQATPAHLAALQGAFTRGCETRGLVPLDSQPSLPPAPDVQGTRLPAQLPLFPSH
jgi:DNA repair photolyase